MVASAETYQLAPVTRAYAERIKDDPRVIELWERKQGNGVELFLHTRPLSREEDAEFAEIEIALQEAIPHAQFMVYGGDEGLFGPEDTFRPPSGGVRVLPE